MNRQAFDTFCASLAGTHMVVQWGGSHVWKVGPKVFAVCSQWGADDGADAGDDKISRIGFKASDLAFEILTAEAGITPSPYLGRYKWVQLQAPDALPEADLKAYIEASYAYACSKLTKAQRKELGL